MTSGSSSRPANAVKILSVLMIDSLATGLFVPLSLVYLEARSGLTLTEIGVLLTLAGVVSLPLPLWIGGLVDRLGARRIVLTSQIIQSIGFFMYLLPQSPFTIFLTATITSLGQRTFWSSVFALVSEVADQDPDPRAQERWLGTIGALRAGGYGFGALLAGLAIALDSLAVSTSIVVVDAGLLLLAAWLLMTVPPSRTGSTKDAREPSRGYRSLLADRPYLALIGLNSVFALCNVMLSVALVPFVARALPNVIWLVGPLLVVNTVVQACFQKLVVRLLRTRSRHTALCLAGALWAAWALLTGATLFLPEVLVAPCLVLSVLFYSAAQLVHSPSSNAMASDAAPLDIRGRYLAAFQYSFAIATVAAPSMASVLVDVGPGALWAVLFVVAASTIPATLLLARYLPTSTLTGQRHGSRSTS